jgi:hypothetical protein
MLPVRKCACPSTHFCDSYGGDELRPEARWHYKQWNRMMNMCAAAYSLALMTQLDIEEGGNARCLISYYNLQEGNGRGWPNETTLKYTEFTSFAHQSYYLFHSLSSSKSTLPFWNPSRTYCNFGWPNSRHKLWSSFSGNEDASPRMFLVDFKQSTVMLLTRFQVFSSGSRSSSAGEEILLVSHAQDGPW